MSSTYWAPNSQECSDEPESSEGAVRDQKYGIWTEPTDRTHVVTRWLDTIEPPFIDMDSKWEIILEKTNTVLSEIDAAQEALALAYPEQLPLVVISAYDALKPVQALGVYTKHYFERALNGMPGRKPSFTRLRGDIELLAKWEKKLKEKVVPTCANDDQKLFIKHYGKVVARLKNIFASDSDKTLTLRTFLAAGSATKPTSEVPAANVNQPGEAPKRADNESATVAGPSSTKVTALATRTLTGIRQDVPESSGEHAAADERGTKRPLSEDEYQLCQELIKRVKKMPESKFFRAGFRDRSPDRPKAPIDISNIEEKLEAGGFKSLGDVHEAVQTMIKDFYPEEAGP